MEEFNKNDRLLYELEQFLITNNASDYLHYFLKSMYPEITSGQTTFIFAPIDVALQRLVERSGKTLEQISTLPEGRDMLTNFLSSEGPTQRGPPVYKAINGAYLKTENDLDRLKPTYTTQLRNLRIHSIDGIINMPGQLQKLQGANPINAIYPIKSTIIGNNTITNFDDFPNPVIRKIVLELSSSDISRICKVGAQFNSVICDSESFWNERTRKDFPQQQVIINNSWKTTYTVLNRKVYTFGAGYHGQLGHGDLEKQIEPKLVEGLIGVTSVSCGTGHTAIIANNLLYTSGLGRDGQLGHGDVRSHSQPKLVEKINTGEELDNVTMVACGSFFTAVISNGRLYTCGWNYYGRLGHGDGIDRDRLTLVERLNNVTFVACGQDHMAAISNGRLYTWGKGEFGRLGHGDELTRNTPKLVEVLRNVSYVACGGSHTAAVSGGRLYMFGSGIIGQLGLGDFRNQLSPEALGGMNNVSMVACGGTHTAVISGGRFYTFGSNSNGQLGHSYNGIFSPTSLDAQNSVTFIACGSAYTTAISNGQLYTFGDGGNGQLGNQGSLVTLNQPRPTVVEGLDGVSFVACGSVHTAAVAN